MGENARKQGCIKDKDHRMTCISLTIPSNTQPIVYLNCSMQKKKKKKRKACSHLLKANWLMQIMGTYHKQQTHLLFLFRLPSRQPLCRMYLPLHERHLNTTFSSLVSAKKKGILACNFQDNKQHITSLGKLKGVINPHGFSP